MENSYLTDILLPVSLFIIMLGMGMSLVPNDFKQVVRYPKAMILGLFGQIIMLPLMALALISLLNVSPMVAVGVMIIAACPGGTSSNLISHLARGDTALSISLTACSSLLTVITIPLIISLSLEHFLSTETVIQLPVLKTIITLIVITLLPVSLGMLIRHKLPQFAIRQERKVNAFSGLFLAFLVVAIIIQQSTAVKAGLIDTGLTVFTLNLVSMFSGYLVSKVAGLNSQQATTITVEIGIQNGTLAILIATTILHQADLAIPAAIYSLAMFFSGGVLIGLRKYSNKP
ncbi:bile acid:sodium symporter family protein [Marinicella sp. S1101]|uniref:bile acid:sodium symporter family protein n=1 Tax=Marinicella marina TaxID=2996016 RepID=UPI00226096B3|nr:bile acid:sodium symporter family protein [Marinicella marina]MCX7554052.1 bile acid:sodium symporter family protein [Marinicella marina]MDJ1140544.1 bile acid:sodium symporter family protein [Marinicella marina]